MIVSKEEMSLICSKKFISWFMPVLLFVSFSSCGNSVTAPTYTIERFNYTTVNSGEPTRLFCATIGSPPLPSTNISVTHALGGDDGIVFLGTTSSSSARTLWYQVVLGLGDAPQSFRCTVHRPDGSNLTRDLNVFVYEPPSFNVFSSLIQDITSHSITLRWSPWTEGRDYGDGPVIGYRVYFNEHGNHNVNPASNDLITDTSFTIHNLTRDTEYDIRVAAVRPGPSGEGTYAPASSRRTLCSATSEAPVLSVQRREQSSVTLGWAMISEESWGCSALSGINIIVDNDALDGFPQTLPFDAEDRTATIPDLQDCTTYRISAAFRNKDEMGVSSDPLLVSTSLTRPTRVERLKLLPFKKQIGVNWDPPSNLCSPDYYIIRYGLYQMLACSSLEPTLNLTDLEVISPTTRYSILGLDPYSRYKVSIIAVNGAGQSEETTGFADTLPGRPSIMKNVRVDRESTSATSIGFTWQPLTCRNIKGVFSYYYARIYKDGDRSLRAAGITYLVDISFSSVEFDNLEPCTMYELNIYAANRDINTGATSFAIGVTGSTFSSANASAVSDQPDLEVQWSVPSQCAVKVDYYKLSYQLISRQACPDVTIIDAMVYHLNTTSSDILVGQRILDLEYYATYNVTIIAVIGKQESSPDFVTGSTSTGVPSPIQSVSYTSTAESLHFIWEEPSCENLHGILHGYEYKLYDTDARTFLLHNTPTTTNILPLLGLDACTLYRFKVRAVMGPVSNIRRSEWYLEKAVTNISAPGAPNITQLTQHQSGIGSTGLTVTWQPPTSPRCQPINYEIKYYLRRGDMCEPIHNDPQMKLAGVVNGSTFNYNIEQLRANSEYQVLVRGNTTSGYGDSDSMAATTGYSYPTGHPTYVHSTSINKRSIVFTWEKPACGQRNGPITCYTVKLSDSKGVVVHLNNVSASESAGYQIFSLIPHSNYSISIRAWNYEFPGEFGQEVWEQTAESKPAPPEQVTLPSSDQESITVEWVSPDPPEGRIIRYYILYWETDAADATPSNVSIPCVDDQCSDLNYRFSGRIPNLKSDTNYSVQVQAESIQGVGPKSPVPAIVREPSAGILPLIEEPVILSITSATVRLQWNAWSEGDGDGYPSIIGYDVFVTRGRDWIIDQRVGQLTTSTTVDDLNPDTDYWFRIAAVGEVPGETWPVSPANTTTTLCGKPSASPTGIQIWATNRRELTLSWQEVAPETAQCRSGITHYVIYYTRSGSSSPQNSLDIYEDTSYIITGLETYMEYTVQITVSNKDEESNMSNEIVGKTLEEVPPAPINLDIPRTTFSTITVSWSTPLPSNINGNIQKYIIRYQEIDSDADEGFTLVEVLSGAFEEERIISYLSPKTDFSVQVQTVNGVGPSDWSEPLNATTIFTGGNDVTKTPLGAVIGGTVVPLMTVLLLIISALCYRRMKQRRSSGLKTLSKAIPTYENPVFDKSNTQPHTYQAVNADDAHIYQSIASYLHTNQDTSPNTHSGPDPTPDAHTYMDPSLDTNTKLDPTPDTRNDLDSSPDTHTYLDPANDLDLNTNRPTHDYSAYEEHSVDTHDYVDPIADNDTDLDPTLDSHTYSNSKVLQPSSLCRSRIE